jgi:hypothetical protein
MMGCLSAREKEVVWQDVERAVAEFETEHGFSGPCELLVAGGTKPV